MRENKFRGKSKLNKEWLFGDLLRLGGNRTPCIFSDKDSIRYFNTDNSVVIPETIGQFTGLRDKNGVKIYEGDILKIKETQFQIGGLHQVAFYEDRYITYSILYNDIDQANKHPLAYQIEYANAHVIGNIHDNPELLNS